MKFKVGDEVKIKFPLHEALAPEWHRKERREGKIGVVVDAMTPKLGVPLYVVEFPDSWTAQYSESYLQLR